jgi:hypothetical protein
MTLETKHRSRDDTVEAYRTEQVVDGTVMRITGAGKYIVYPNTGRNGVRVGNPVRVIVAEKTVRPIVSLEVREERISSPISSTWAIIVSGHESIERCQVFYNHMQLSTIDHLGELKSEMRMPRDSSLSFHIPDSMELNDAYMVEVFDGEHLLRSDTFGSVRTIGMATSPRPASAKTTTTTTTTTS